MKTRAIPAGAVVVVVCTLVGGVLGTQVGAAQGRDKINQRYYQYQAAQIGRAHV